VYQIIRDLFFLIWHGRQSTENLQLQQAQAATQQAKVAMEMSLELVAEYKQRFERIEARLDERDNELDNLKVERLKDHAKLAEMQIRLKRYEEEVKQYKRTISEMTLNYEKTIADLKGRIAELEAKSDG
jgi:chromosome segregation ATPase